VVVLVTGGAGFIGSHIVDLLVAAGAHVRVIDALLPSAHRARPAHLNPGAEYVTADLRDTQKVEEVVDGVTAVCHQASMVGLGVDAGDVVDYVAHNDAGTASLLLALHRRGFGGRVVLGSSMVVYGEGAYRCPACGPVRPGPRHRKRLEAGAFEPPCPRCDGDLEPVPIGEDAPADPRNFYAATKLHQEHLCSVFARERSIPLVVLRYHNVYGPRMPKDTPYAGVAAIFRSALEAARPPRVFEDGRQMRDFVHVRDVARANLLALAADAPTGIFNVASGDPHSVGEMAHVLCAVAGNGARPLVTGEYRLGDVRHVFASIDRAQRLLGYEPEVGFENGLRAFARCPLRS
jgi:dTDP-L-rhamnose 4-epimerase